MAQRRVGKKPDTPCSVCGTLLYSSPGSLPPDRRVCRPCRQANPASSHPTPRKRCKCDECRAKRAAAMRDYTRMVRERDGLSPTQKYRPAQGRYTPCVGGCGKTSKSRRCRNCRRSADRRRAEMQRRLDQASVGTAPYAHWPWVSGVCAGCGDAFTRRGEASPFCSKRCGRSDKAARRRALESAAFVAPVYRLQVFKRDGWRCQICRRKVDRTKTAPHPRAPTLDHIVPLAKGGTHEPSNCQLACSRCNSIKSDGAANDQLRLIG